MKSVLSTLTAAISLGAIMSAPALAQESDVSFTYQGRVQEESYRADIGATLGEGESVYEQMFLINWNVSSDFSLALDVWNSEAISSDSTTIDDLVHETDLELEAAWRNVISEWDFRAKAAVYEISGPEIYSVRFAADHPVGEHCTGTGSLELMQGGFDFGILKGSVACASTWRGWTGFAEVGAAYNTLNNSAVAPFMLRAMYGETFSVGPYIRGYAGDQSDAAVGIQFVLTH